MADVENDLPPLLHRLTKNVDEANALCDQVLQLMQGWPRANPIQNDPHVRQIVATMPRPPDTRGMEAQAVMEAYAEFQTREACWLADHPEVNFNTPITQAQRLLAMLRAAREDAASLESSIGEPVAEAE